MSLSVLPIPTAISSYLVLRRFKGKMGKVERHDEGPDHVDLPASEFDIPSSASPEARARSRLRILIVGLGDGGRTLKFHPVTPVRQTRVLHHRS